MLLDDLVKAIETVQKRIDDHRDSLSQNEYRTRISLIDPILNALGWDVANPALVTIEDHHSGSGTPDYGLLGKEKSQPIAFIEAKRLGEHLDAHQDQIFKYTWDRKVFYAALTDGSRWILRDVTAEFSRPPREGLLLDLTLADETPHQCALKLLLLWRQTFVDGQPIEANRPIFVTPPDPKPPPPPPRQDWIQLTNYEYSLGQPLVLRLPDGQEKELGHWYEIAGSVAEWLIKERKLTTSMCPIRDIVSSDLKSEGGARFLRYRRLRNGIFINTNKSAKDHLRGTKILLQHCNQDPASILLKPN